MIARLLGAKVVLTEQDELLGLLEGNLNANFPGDDSIRWAALDWEREEDVASLQASFLELNQSGKTATKRTEPIPPQRQQPSPSSQHQQKQQQGNCHDEGSGEGCDSPAVSGGSCRERCAIDSSALRVEAPATEHTDPRRSCGGLDFILCAEYV